MLELDPLIVEEMNRALRIQEQLPKLKALGKALQGIVQKYEGTKKKKTPKTKTESVVKDSIKEYDLGHLLGS